MDPREESGDRNTTGIDGSSWGRAWPLLVTATAIAMQYRAADVLLRGRVFWFEDIAAYFVPLYSAAARLMRAGSLGSLDGGAWAGQPILGDPQVGMLYPLNWLWLWVRPVR